MEGADHQVAGVAADERLQPVAHLSRRLVGEGHGEDVPGHDAALLRDVGDAMGDYAGVVAKNTLSNEVVGSFHGKVIHPSFILDILDRLHFRIHELCCSMNVEIARPLTSM